MRLQTTRQAGFTLMEMLITIAVLAILVSLAVPSFRQFIQNNRLSSEANELVAAMQYGRSEALRRGEEVRVCASNNQTSCTGSWNQGWIAVIDPGGSDEEVLRVWQSPGTDFQFSPANGTVDFNREGFSTSGAQTFDMQLEGCTTNNARQVQIEPSGRVASQRVNCPT